MTEIELRPRQTDALIGATFTVFRNRFGPMVMASLIFVVPYIVLLFLGRGLGYRDLESIAILLLPIAFGATIFLAAGAYVGVEPDWREAVRFAGRGYILLLVASVLAIAAIVFGFLLLIIPGIFLLISFALALEAIMLEGEGPLSGLGRSWRLTKGHRGRIFLVGFLFFFVVFLVFGITVGIDPFAFEVWAGLANLVIIPLISALGVAIYFDLRVRKENLDAQTDQIDQIRMRLGAGTMGMTEIELRPRRTGELIDSTITVFSDRFGPMVMATLIFVVPYLVLLLLGLETIAVLLVPVAFGATIFLAAGAYVGVEPDWREAVGFAWKEYLPLLIASVLATVAIVVGFILIIPGIILLISFALALEAIMLEGEGALSGLGRSRRLVKKHKGRIFLVGFLFFLVVFLVLGGIDWALYLALSWDHSGWVWEVWELWRGITYLVAIPLLSALGVAIYFDLRVRKENLDAQADQIDDIRMRLGCHTMGYD